MGRALPTRPAADPGRRRRQLGRYFPGVRLATRIEVLPDLGLVYVRNPKVATSTLLAWLDRMATGQQRAPGEDVRRTNALPKPRDVGWDRVMRMIDGDALRFSFVRDPVTRFESAYRSKILQQTPSRRRLLEQAGRAAEDPRPVGFEEFLALVEQQEPLSMDLHWRPQHLNLMHPVFAFDVLGRLESFDRDLEEVRRRLDLPSPPTQVRNVSRGEHPSAYLDRPDLVERVRALYSRDIELYGY